MQRNYKSLILKLTGTALGLVVMLVGAATLGQNFLADKSVHAMDSHDQFSFTSQKDLSPEELKFRLSMNDEFRIVVESRHLSADKAMKKARFALDAVKARQFESQFELNSGAIEALNEAIAEISHEISIPNALREEILSSLDQQLELAEKKLSRLENHVLKFSYRLDVPHSEYSTSGKCNEGSVVVKKCDNDECGKADIKKSSKDNRKGAVAAFYWI